MKKVIKNRIYDTSTAVKLASWKFGGGPRDFHHITETLYRKKVGEFFLHGEGGPATQYAVSIGAGRWEGGEKILPLTYAEADAWAEEKLEADVYERIFGPVSDDSTETLVSFKLPTYLHDALKRRASAKQIGLSEVLADILKKEFPTKKK